MCIRDRFVNGENIVNMTEIGTVTFQAAENANLDNNSDDTKAVSYTHLDVYKRQFLFYGGNFFIRRRRMGRSQHFFNCRIGLNTIQNLLNIIHGICHIIDSEACYLCVIVS